MNLPMRSTDAIVKQYSFAGHFLGSHLSQEEAVSLVQPLRDRLHSSQKELDLSPASLKRLERRLVRLHEHMDAEGANLDDNELVQFVREIAGYLGLVLVNHAGGEWTRRGSLWSSEVLIPGPIRVDEGKQSFTSPYPMIILLGHIAGASWELIERGLDPKLYSTFSSAKRRVSKQELNKKR